LKYLGRKNKTIELPLFNRYETPIRSIITYQLLYILIFLDLASALMSDNSVTSFYIWSLSFYSRILKQKQIDLLLIAETTYQRCFFSS
ncbi:hypothetical protein RhiirA5_467032, partial [Rhizophagus irregularis]